MSQQFTDGDIRAMLEHCSDFTERLSAWERGFIESIAEQFEQRGALSEKQQETLDRIYTKLP